MTESSKKSNLILMSSPRILLKQLAKEAKHSDEFIEEILAYSDKLEAAGLPLIFSIIHFSVLVGIEAGEIKKIINSRIHHYKKYSIKKKKGGEREISSPFRTIKFLQEWIRLNILEKVPIHERAFGFCKGKSIVDNAKEHLGQDFILNIDLLKFFDSITEERVYGIFKSLGYHPNLAVTFAKLCTVCLDNSDFDNIQVIDNSMYVDPLDNIDILKTKEKAVLPQGAPTSPVLSNLICRRLDKRLQSYALKNGFTYTRYADDITFSGKGTNFPKISLIEKIIENESFKINKEKIKLYNKNSNKPLVTGLVVKNEVTLLRRFKKEIERHLFFCEKKTVKGHIEYLEKEYNFSKSFYREWLLGKIFYIKMVEPEYGQKLLSRFILLDWGLEVNIF